MVMPSRFLSAAVFFLLLVLGRGANAQVSLGLSLLEDGETFVVSLISQAEWPVPFNAVGAAQIVLRTEADASFTATEVTSLIPGTTWSDNVYLDDLSGTSEYRFVCFTLNEKGTRNIPFIAGEETPLFSFKNAGGACPGELHLVNNQDSYVQEVILADQVNITQNLAVLGARGNAFEGIHTQPVSCTTVAVKNPVSLQRFTAFPNPVHDKLTLGWSLSGEAYINQLHVTTLSGKSVATFPVDNRVTEFTFSVEQWPSGVYFGTLSGSGGFSKVFSFTVTRR